MDERAEVKKDELRRFRLDLADTSDAVVRALNCFVIAGGQFMSLDLRRAGGGLALYVAAGAEPRTRRPSGAQAADRAFGARRNPGWLHRRRREVERSCGLG